MSVRILTAHADLCQRPARCVVRWLAGRRTGAGVVSDTPRPPMELRVIALAIVNGSLAGATGRP